MGGKDCCLSLSYNRVLREMQPIAIQRGLILTEDDLLSSGVVVPFLSI